MLVEVQSRVGESAFAYPAPQTLLDAISVHAAQTPHAPAFIFDDLSEISYRTLRERVKVIGDALHRAGIGGRHRIAVVMPQGPMLAMTVVGIACHATFIALSPELSAADTEDLFARLDLAAIVVAADADIPARAVAVRHGATLFEASGRNSDVVLALRTPPRARAAAGVGPDDYAMILRTSGTTARPKLVPVTHRGLQSMAARRRHWFGLGPKDRGICVNPLHYAQGLFNTLFVQLFLGASVAFPPRISAADFCTWLGKFAPTWYSAGPTFHRAVLEHARSIPKGELRHSLRFIQSGAAPLPSAVHEGLEGIFGVPVVDSLGLSEAGNIAGNTVAPTGRRRGTVGKAWPRELALLGHDGKVVTSGGPGEILLRGPGVAPCYLGDAEANRAAFIDGWFRTGDIGRIDADGFVTIVGRIKELINRGGEKVAPAEIDEALLRHPDVVDAAAFPVPHPRLGEDVAVAAMLRLGATATPLELREFLQASLASFKIPRRIHLVSSLPKGDTGKVLRQKLSQQFGAPQKQAKIEWASQLEVEIANIWKRLLQCDVGPNDDFFELGGDSLLALEMLLAIERMTARTLPTSILFKAATVRELTQILAQEGPLKQEPLVQLSQGEGTPFFFFHGAFNTGGGYTRELAKLAAPDQSFYIVSPHGLDAASIPRSIEAMAADRLSHIRQTQLHGPYRLGGYCLSGLVAFEAARLLIAAGEKVEFVAMIDPPTVNARLSVQALLSAWALARRVMGPTLESDLVEAWQNLTRADKASDLSMARLWQSWIQVWWRWLKVKAKRTAVTSHKRVLAHGADDPARRSFDTGDRYALAMAAYRPAPLTVRTVYFAAEFNPAPWRRISSDLEVINLAGNHADVVYDPSELGRHLRALLAASPKEARG